MNYGPRRIQEVSARIPEGEALTAIADGVAASAGDPDAMRGFVEYARMLGEQRTPLTTVGERAASLAALREAVERVGDQVTPGSPAREQLVALQEVLHEMSDQVRKERDSLGHCRIRIDGQSVRPANYQIVIPAEPTPQEETAARDLRAHLERITGEALPLVREGDDTGRYGFLVGRCAATAELGVDVDYDALGLEGIRVATAGPNVVLTGNKRGVLYAVYSFLEDQLGCRWFTEDCMTWPTKGEIELGRVDVTYVPPLEYRATDYPCSRPKEFAVRNRLNGQLVDAPEEWGDHITYRGFVHTFNSLVPPEQYYDEHPEYFSEIGGKRIRDYAQLCLTNPDVLRIATETVRRWIADDPHATIISVSQNDWHNPCQCEKCKALAEEEGSEMGPLLHFVNAIADDIATDHPNIIIDTLAYQYTRKPPLHVRPRPNVAIRLCSIECEFNRPLATSSFNATFVDDIRGWNAICNRLHIWDYVINYAHSVQPFPNLRVLKPNIQFFIDNGVTGIYEEACYFTKGSEMAELRTYLMAKLLWDPSFDVERGIDEFCAAYYGPAAHLIRNYIDDIHRLAISDDDFHMPIYVSPKSPFQTDEAIARYEGWFDEAEKLTADDPVRLHRVQVARLPIIYTRIVHGSAPGYELTDDALVAAGTNKIAGLVERFADIAHAEGMTAVSEGGVGRELEPWLAAMRAPKDRVPVVRLDNGQCDAVIVPSLGGRVLSLRAKVGDREPYEAMQIVHTGDGIDPTTGGYEEFSEVGYRSPGWTEAYEVAASDRFGVTLRADLSNGLRIERRYELDSRLPTLTITSTLTNISDGPRTACLRVHPCMALGDATKATLSYDGRAQSLAEGADTEKELWLRGNDRPDGEWSVTQEDKGVRVISRFDPAQVEVCYLNWKGPDHRFNLELYSPSTELAPGESLTLKHGYEVRPE
jgi:hypothetical protein